MFIRIFRVKQVKNLPQTCHSHAILKVRIPKNNEGVHGSWMMMFECLTCEVFSSQVTDAKTVFYFRIRHLAGSAMVKPGMNT